MINPAIAKLNEFVRTILAISCVVKYWSSRFSADILESLRNTIISKIIVMDIMGELCLQYLWYYLQWRNQLTYVSKKTIIRIKQETINATINLHKTAIKQNFAAVTFLSTSIGTSY